MSKSIGMLLSEYNSQETKTIVIGSIAFKELLETEPSGLVHVPDLTTFNGIVIEEHEKENYWEVRDYA